MPACANALFYAGRGLLLHAILHGPWAREPTRIAVLLYPPPYFSKKKWSTHFLTPQSFYSDRALHCIQFCMGFGQGNQPELLLYTLLMFLNGKICCKQWTWALGTKKYFAAPTHVAATEETPHVQCLGPPRSDPYAEDRAIILSGTCSRITVE